MAFGGPPSTPAFGGSSFGGFGQNNQAGGGLFGSKPQSTPSLFGASTPNAFGSSAPQQTNAFGTPSFGGAASTSAGAGSLFSSTPAKPTTSFSFGASTPAATPAPNAGFGGAPTTTFGAPTPSAFGGGGGFGSGMAPAGPQAIPQNGTASMKTAFAPVQEKDAKDKFIDKPTHAWYHIGYMDEFKNASPEELRWQDYQQGRKDRLKQPLDAAPAGGFGASTGLFGSQGASGGFGSPAGGAFGKPATGGFGSPAGGGLFGQQSQPQQQSNPFAPQQNNSPFGQNTAQQPATSFGGGFGQQQQTAGQSPFGANKPAFGAPAAGSTFGSPAANTSAGGFGGASTGGFSFGSKPATSTPSLFGGTSAAQPSTGFGQPSGGGLFGQPQSQPQQSTGFSFGSNNNATQPGQSTFGQPASNSLFGGQQQQQPQQQSQPSTGGFSFGASNTTGQNQSLFGGNTGTGSTFGGFGQQQQQPQQPANPFGGGGLGGATSTPQFGAGSTSTAPTGGLFGQQQQPQQQQQQQPGGGLFGGQQNTSNTGSLFGGGGAGAFGQTGQQSQPQQSGGLFSFGKPATSTGGTGGGLFGNTNTNNQQPAAGGSLFGGGGGGFGSGLGQNQQNQQGSTNTGSLFGGGSLFGSKPNPTPSQPLGATGGGGLFGSTFGQSQNQGGMLGQSQQQNQQAPNLNATPYGASPLFSSVQSKPQNNAPFAPEASTNDKALFSRSPVPGPRVQNTPKSFNKVTRIRFMTPSSSSTSLNDRSASPSLGDVNFGPGTFSARSNIKRLELDRKGSLGDLRSRSASLPPSVAGTPNKSNSSSLLLGQDKAGSSLRASDRVSIDPASDAAASPGHLNLTLRLRKEGDGASASHTPPPLPRTLNPAKARRSPTVVVGGGGSAESSSVNAAAAGDAGANEATEYICTPSIAELERFSPAELARVENLKVEKPGFGSLTWLEPVDLTSLDSLNDLVGGQLVQIDGSGVELYQDMEYPAPGTELNKAALVSIENVWPKNRSTGVRGPTKDEDALAHHRKELKKRLKKFQGEFVEYDDQSGRWTFKVPFFWDGKRKS